MRHNPKENRLVVRHVVEEFLGKGNLKSYEEFIAEDVLVHCPLSWEKIHTSEIVNKANTKKIDQEYAKALHFNKIYIFDMMGDQDKVSIRWGGVGIHQGDFFSIPASYRPFEVSGQTLYRINKDHQIEEVWQSWDMLGLFNQIGFSFKAPLIPFKELDKLLKKAKGLSKRELDCLRHLLEGKTSKETATELCLSFRTVEYYFENIKDKLDCSCKKELYRFARILETYHLL
jgi:DNA-binding CsgD family transcriptional regulator